MTWTPELGATISLMSGSSIFRIASVKGPVALMIPLVLIVNSSAFLPFRSCTRSLTRAPLNFPSAPFSKPVTSIWFTTVAPYKAAVIANDTFIRESL